MATFLDLPGELRNCIYELYMTRVPSSPRSAKFYDNDYLPPALARVSRQIRAEFISVWETTPWSVEKVTNLKICVNDLDLDGVASFFDGSVESVPPCLDRVSIDFSFSDVAEIANNARSVRKWSMVDFLHWNRSIYDGRVVVSYRMMFNWWPNGRHRVGLPTTVRHKPSVKLLKEIARKAKDVAAGEPLGRQEREKLFRAWVIREVREQEEEKECLQHEAIARKILTERIRAESLRL